MSNKAKIKQLRKQFNQKCLDRDDHRCRFCGSPDAVVVHHITDRHEMPNGGYVEQNGLTLCPVHHKDAELFHETDGGTWVEGMNPDDLYKMIETTKEKAIMECEKL